MDIYVNNETRIENTYLEIGIYDAFRKRYGTGISIKLHIERYFKYVIWTRYHIYISYDKYAGDDYYRIDLLDTYFNKGEAQVIKLERINDITNVIERMLYKIDPCSSYTIDTDIASMYPKTEGEIMTIEEIRYMMNDVKVTVDTYRYMKGENNMLPKIKKVHFNDPVTVVIWEDGTKTIVRAQDDESYDREKGLSMCIAKKAIGNTGKYYDIFKEHLKDYEPKKEPVKATERPKVFTETAEQYSEEVKKQKKIGDGYDDIRWEKNARRVRK